MGEKPSKHKQHMNTATNARLRTYALYLMSGFYLFAGFNHFWHPDFYLPLIPEWLPAPSLLNKVSGIAEMVLGAMLLYQPGRVLAGWGIIMLLVAFIPSHIYFIQLGGCVSEGLCVPGWVAWVRLLLIHPLLMGWAWWCAIKN